MIRMFLAVGVAIAASVLGSAASSQAAAEPGVVQRGRALVESNCAACHAVGRSGDSPNREAPPFRRLGERYDIDALGEGLAEGLSVGHGPMPEWRFDPNDVAAILAYLKDIQAREPVARTKDGASRR